MVQLKPSNIILINVYVVPFFIDSPGSALQPQKESSQLASPHSVTPPAVHAGGASLKAGSVSSREGNRFTQEQLELFERRYDWYSLLQP